VSSLKKWIDSNNNIDSVAVNLVPPLSDEPAAAHATKKNGTTIGTDNKLFSSVMKI